MGHKGEIMFVGIMGMGLELGSFEKWGEED